MKKQFSSEIMNTIITTKILLKKLGLAMLSLTLIAGCTQSRIMKNPPLNAPSDDASIKLAEAATSISDSMMEMARVEKVLLPREADNVVNIPSTYNLQTRASIDWDGPIEDLVTRIANAAHYRFRVLGQAPAIPVLINLNAKDQSLAEILRNIDYQAGNKAYIHVFPKNQVIELRYAKFYN